MNRYIFIKVIMFFLLSFSLFAEQKETIVWVKIDAPPYFIYNGDYKGMGIGDNIIKILIKNLPEYNHEIAEEIPITRMEKMMEQGKNICFVLSFKNELREKIMLFSKVSSINPAYKIITTKEKYEKFNLKESEYLERLLKNIKIKAGIADRAYGMILDHIIFKYKNNKNIYVRTGINIFTRLFDMLENRRVDFIIALPYEVKYHMKMNRKNLEDIKTIEIEELKEEKLMYAYVGVTKNEWGKKLISKVNIILEKERKKESYFNIFSEWLDEDSIKKTKIEWKNKIISEEK